MRKYNILIVDDILMNRVLLKELLFETADEVIEAKNGLEAIEMLESNKIDIILMDIEMPKMNGLETTKYIRNEMPSPKCNIPIIALTAHNPNDFFEDFSSVGFTNLITKPYSFDKIQDSIETAIKIKNY